MGSDANLINEDRAETAGLHVAGHSHREIRTLLSCSKTDVNDAIRIIRIQGRTLIDLEEGDPSSVPSGKNVIW